MSIQGVSFFPKTRFQGDLTLLLVAILWGSSFVAQRSAALQGGVHFYNGVRLLLAAFLLIPILIQQKPNFESYTWKGWFGGILAGIALFGGTALQQIGIQFTTTANAGFITGLYVVFVPFVLAFVYRKPPSGIIWLASLIAFVGMFLLSTGGQIALSKGDGWELAGALMWTAHVLIIDSVTHELNLFVLAFLQFLLSGLLSLGLGVTVEHATLSSLTGIWWAVIWTAVVSIALGYTLQALGQRAAPPADAAIILCLESVFAAFFGWIILKESMTFVQLFGSVLMLSGMILIQFFSQTVRINVSRKE